MGGAIADVSDRGRTVEEWREEVGRMAQLN